MPKASAREEKPRRRSSSAAVIDESAERGIFLRMLLHSPKDMVAGMLAFAAVTAIIGNAIFLQAGHHPAPMFGSSVTVPLPAPSSTSPLPKPRPLDAASRSDSTTLDPRMLDSRPVDGKSAETKSQIKAVDAHVADPIAILAKSPSTPSANSVAVARPPAPIPANRNDPLGDLIVNSRRVASVQRALTEYGYGQLKATGTVGSDTQAAIQRFEKERKMPVTGQISDRLVHELSAITGRSID